ncbi:DoxX family protein [Rhodopirellula sp. JC639]|uniref:DoxX family protein n=1 Tax=Stieleria mannarensis TaxID=2755585 RepID=UPI001601802B|nr:hypothetical protein [Rhodopirellula sp. JC639]
MTTPAIILLLLMVPFLVSLAIRYFHRSENLVSVFSAVLGIALVFAFTGIGHFVKTQPMSEMLPSAVPLKIPLIYLTGVLELTAAAAVLVPRLRRHVGWCLILMLLSFLPVNIYAAINRMGMGGHQWGPSYLLIRVPLQMVLISWVWYFAVRASHGAAAGKGNMA